ncbi:MAG: hypothetical protein AAGB93_01090 [Planctomycetota bacterium]
MHPCRHVVSLSLGFGFFSPLLHAQSGIVELARVGDSVSGGASVTGFSNIRVNDRGEWAAIVGTDSAASPDRLFVNGNQILREGETAPAAPGQTVLEIRDVDLADDGRLAVLTELDGGFAVYFDGELVLRQDEPASAADFGPTAVYADVQKVNVNAANGLLIRAAVDLNPGLVSALVRLDVGAGGAILSETVLGQSGDSFPGSVGALSFFQLDDNAVTVQDDGQGTWCGRMGSPGSIDWVAYKNGTIPIYRGGQPAFAGGPDFVNEPLRATASNASASWAISARLDVANPDQDGVLLLDGASYAREGANLTAFPGAPVVERIGYENLYLTDANEPIFLVDVDIALPTDRAIIKGDEVFLRMGDPVVGGGSVTDLSDFPSAFHASENGEFLIAIAQVNGSTTSLLYVQDGLGEAYCAAENNSTGFPSVTTAEGVGLVSANSLRLVTTDAPAGSFGYYISSLTPGNTLGAGGSSGRICVSGSVGRHIDGVAQVEPDGTFRYSPDLTSMPTSPNVAVMVGDTWHFQFWHRDAGAMGTATSNFSLPVRVSFH